MKKLIYLIPLMILSHNLYSQTMIGGDLGGAGGMLNFRKSPEFNDANTAGSKYITDNYQSTRVNKGEQNFLIRYNAYNDVMEYKNGTDILELIKEKNTHFIFQDGSVYELFNYTADGKNYERYQKVLVDKNNVKISKFQSIKLIPAKKATNSYDTDTQATYKTNREEYFITYNNQTFEFDGKEKTLTKAIPGKADAIKKFYKENKIKENDNDMIKLGNFLATI